MREAFIDKLEKIEGLVNDYHELLNDDAQYLRQVHGVIGAEELAKQLQQIAEENRLLTIGIIGKVKAGKSSLLNSLFFNGDSILPEAPTPMTAALTLLSYGKQCAATAEFFATEDLETIRSEHREFQGLYDRVLLEKKIKAEERAKRNGETLTKEQIEQKARTAANEDEKISQDRRKPSYDQYEQMKKSDQNPDTVCAAKEKSIAASSPRELKGRLQDFVGAAGPYMPFTKSVRLIMDIEGLKDIRVVDTPGLNDPIKTREARTEEYLRECDVVFIISSAGHFISEQDMELMDRLSAKEGVRQLFLVASMSDIGVRLQSIVENSDGVLSKAIASLREELAGHASSALSALKKRHPEVGGDFDQLINESENRIFITSGLCNSMALRFDDQSSWSESMKGSLAKLAEYYPDNFSGSSARASLELLGNTAPVREKLQEVRGMKDAIIAEKSADYRKRQAVNIDEYQNALKEAVRERQEKLNSSDLETIKRNKQKLEAFIEAGSETINDKLREHIDGAQGRLKEKLSEHTRHLNQDASRSLESNTEQSIERETIREKKEGAGAAIGRFFGGLLGTDSGWDVHLIEHEIHTLRAGPVKRVVSNGAGDFILSIEGLVEEAITSIKTELPAQIKKAFRDAAEEGIIDPAFLNRAINSMVQTYTADIEWNVKAPQFSYPEAGTLDNEREIEMFYDAVDNFLNELRDLCRNGIKNLFSRIEKNRAGSDPCEFVFGDIKKQIAVLEQDIAHKTETLKKFAEIQVKLEEIP